VGYLTVFLIRSSKLKNNRYYLSTSFFHVFLNFFINAFIGEFIMAASFINPPHRSRNNSRRLLVAFLCLFASQSPVQAASTMVFETGLETGTLTGLDLHVAGGTVAATATPVATGQYSAKYDLVRDMTKDTYRSETYIANGKGDFAFNTEYWFSMNYLYKDWAIDKSAESAPFQVHRVPSKWKAGCGGEVSAYSVAPFLMLSQNDVVKVITKGGVVSWSGPVVKNQWQNIIFHFKITWDKTGYVEAWKDGVKLFRRDAKLHEQYDDCGQPFRSPRFNIGTYKWDWKVGRPATQSSRRTLYIDNVRITKGTSLY
jgi:Polysaccharide lyase